MRKIALILMIVLTSCVPLRGIEVETPIKEYLYDNITIEIQPSDGAGFVNSEMQLLKAKMHHYKICRSDRVSVVVRSIVQAPTTTWPRKMIKSFQNNHQTLVDRNIRDKHLIVFVSIIPGNYTVPGKTNIIGLAFADQHITIFNDNFNHAVLLHEIGHVIGLVNRNVRDEEPVNPDRPKHCNNVKCVMFWQVNKGARFDSLCRRDIQDLINTSRN
jgi:hypothetical protein